jgi:WD40 repeat protein
MFSPDSHYILMQDDEESSRGVILWDIQSGKEVHSFGTHVVYAKFIDNGQRIATITTLDTVKEKYIVWDVSTYKQVNALDIGSNITNATFSDNGKYFVVENNYTHSTLWDTDKGQPLHVFIEPIFDYQFTPDNRYLIYSVPLADRPFYRLWDLEKQKESEFVINDSAVTIGLSPNGKYLATASDNGQLRLWNLETGNEMHLDC